MKRVLAFIVALTMLLPILGCAAQSGETTDNSPAEATEAAEATAAETVETELSRGSKIGILCSPVSWGEENYRMVEKYIAEYGEDRFILNTIPDDADTQTQITLAQNMAMDPECTVIIFNEAVAGGIAAMNAARAINPDIVIIAVNLNEEPIEVASVADMACGKSLVDFATSIVNTAAAKGLEVVSYLVPADTMGSTNNVTRIETMQSVGEELGINVVVTVLPNQQDANARTALEQAAKEDVYNKTNEYGDKVGFFCASSFAYVPTLTGIIECKKGYLISLADPGPFGPAYCDVFGIVAPDDHQLDLEWTNKAIAEKCVENDVVGRFGNWKFSFLSSFMSASIEYAMAYQAGEVERSDTDVWMNYFAEANDLSSSDFTYGPYVQDGVTYSNLIMINGAIQFYGEDLGVD